MIDGSASRSLGLVSLGLITAAVLAIPAPVRAADPSASLADLTLRAVSYSHAAQTSTGTMTLIINSTTTTAGWHVTILASAFAYSGPSNGSNIPAAKFSLTSASAPAMTSGQAIDSTGGPMVPATSPVGSLDVARTTVQASPGFGQGTDSQALGVSLAIPAQSASGSYAGTLAVTAAVGP